MHPEDRFLSYIALALALFGCFWGLGSYPLLDNNEGLYAQIAREMMQTGNYIIPHLNGLPYIEKPPLLYWLTALSFRLFEFGEWQARLPVALATFSLCALTLGFGRRMLQPRAGAFAALILTSSIVFCIIGRTVFFDMLLTLWLTGAFFSGYLWLREGDKKWLRWSYAGLALAVLTKGLLPLVAAGLTVVILLSLARNARWKNAFPFLSLRGLLDGWGIALFMALALPWHIAASMLHPGFAHYYLIGENFLRFVGTREPHDYYTGPLYYYLPRIPLYLFPWSLLLPLLAWPRPALSGETRALRLFLWIWFAVLLAIFSFSQAKANYYLVTAMPPLALLLALRMEEWMQAKRAWPFWSVAVLSYALLLAGILAKPYWCSQVHEPFRVLCEGLGWKNIIPFLLAGALFIGIAIRWRLLAAPMGIGLLIVPLLLLALQIMPLAAPFVSQKPLAETLLGLPRQPVYLFHDYERLSSLPFYLQQPVGIIDSYSADLLYGQRQEKNSRAFLTLQQFGELTRAQSAFLITRVKYLPGLSGLFAQTQWCAVARNGDTLAFTNNRILCK